MRRTHLLAPIAVLALIPALAGCGDDGGSDSDSDPKDDSHPVVALTEEQIAEAVLQADNLGEGWTAEPSEEDEEDTAPDCLAEVESLIDQLERKARGGTEFAYGDSDLSVESTVSAYEDENAITALFDQVQTVLGACGSVSDTDEDGNTTELTLTVDDAATHADVDDQYHLSGTGTYTTASGQSADIYLEQTSVRVGPNVATINTFGLQSRTEEHATWAGIAVERLVDVAHGEEPEATTAPAPEGAETEPTDTETDTDTDTDTDSTVDPETKATLVNSLEAAGLTPEQADCVAEKVLSGGLSEEQIDALERDEAESGLSPEDEQEVVDLIAESTTACVSAG